MPKITLKFPLPCHVPDSALSQEMVPPMWCTNESLDEILTSSVSLASASNPSQGPSVHLLTKSPAHPVTSLWWPPPTLMPRPLGWAVTHTKATAPH